MRRDAPQFGVGIAAPLIDRLLSLKAEILRKQEDVARAKIENDGKIRTIKKKYTVKKNKGIENREINDLTEEDHDLLRLSKLVTKLNKSHMNYSEDTKLVLLSFSFQASLHIHFFQLLASYFITSVNPTYVTLSDRD
ncbi:hypothetical protein D910_11743 [Dendroctonus ponderosae]|uniref:Uncharacterized protein n=1 Tax=Dendroctonus ponderosae TaxID=77166 RepID=U4UW30_DENPD|nr:hypothetical protein D910_11743 [Dendroctonus ponderosae]